MYVYKLSGSHTAIKEMASLSLVIFSLCSNIFTCSRTYMYIKLFLTTWLISEYQDAAEVLIFLLLNEN